MMPFLLFDDFQIKKRFVKLIDCTSSIAAKRSWCKRVLLYLLVPGEIVAVVTVASGGFVDWALQI